MTLAELKTLRRGERVVCGSGRVKSHRGVVEEADEQCLEIWWPDGTSTLIWFAHCADGRDCRHERLHRLVPPPRPGKVAA